jgi:hypothetical protein
MNVLRDGKRGSQKRRQNELRMHAGTKVNERQMQMRITEEKERIANAHALRTVKVEMKSKIQQSACIMGIK